MAETDTLVRSTTAVQDLVLHAADYPVKTVYSWERHGQFYSKYPGDEIEAPYDATEIFVRLYPFPEGDVREIYLDARSRTHHHISKEDILFYQVSGRRVQIVNERSHEVNPGDASIQISGVYKRVDQIIPGVFLEFSMLRPFKDGAEATWVDAGDVPVTTVDGCQKKTFPLQGYELHEVVMPKGARLAGRHEWGTLFYVVEGSLKVRIGDLEDTVAARDALRAPAGMDYALEALEACKVVYAHIPPTRPQA